MLKKAKIRMTRQRKVILEELRKVHSHPTADEIYVMVRKRLPHIGLGTVYRNLELLSKLGKIQTLELGGTQKRFDGNPEPHYHLRCVNPECNKVDDAPVMFRNIEQELSGKTDFNIIGHRLEFVGYCPECAKELGVDSLGFFHNLRFRYYPENDEKEMPKTPFSDL